MIKKLNDIFTNKKDCNIILPFFSRHDPTPAQIATISQIKNENNQNYCGMKKMNFSFGEDPVTEIHDILRTDDYFYDKNDPHKIAIVAPLHISAKLLNDKMSLISFENMPSARDRKVFINKGAYVFSSKFQEISHNARFHKPIHFDNIIDIKYVKCPISPTDQEEKSLY